MTHKMLEDGVFKAMPTKLSQQDWLKAQRERRAWYLEMSKNEKLVSLSGNNERMLKSIETILIAKGLLK